MQFVTFQMSSNFDEKKNCTKAQYLTLCVPEEKVDHYAPVQLKEWVPDHLNPSIKLNSLISGLQMYKDSRDLIVGIYSSRTGTFRLSDIVCPALNLAELWIFGSIAPDKSKWFLYGDVLGDKQYHEFLYPT